MGVCNSSKTNNNNNNNIGNSSKTTDNYYSNKVKLEKNNNLNINNNVHLNTIQLNTDNPNYSEYLNSNNKASDILSGFKEGFKKYMFKENKEDSDKVSKQINFELAGKGIGNPLENYLIERPLYESSVGAIWLAKHKLTQTLRTMKIHSKDILNNYNEKALLQNLDVLRKMDHPNIVKIFEFYNETDKLYIIQEYGQGGDLLEYVVENSPIDEFSAAYIVHQILYAIYFGHLSNIFHLDLKPENIIIDYIANGLVHIKIMDFNCTEVKNNQILKKNNYMPMSSIYFAPPEAFNSVYNSYSDLWSIGVILYLLLSGKAPFMGEKENEVKEKINRGSYDIKNYPWNKISKEAKDLVNKLLVKNPDDRIKLKDALDHVWFKKLNLIEKTNYIERSVLLKQICNLKNYNYKKTLHDAVLTFLIHNSLHLPQMRDSCKMFNLFDYNKDGVVSIEDLNKAIENYIYNQDYGEYYEEFENCEFLADEILSNVDKNQRGYIEFEEFVKACVDKERLLADDILRYAFSYFDKDKSGDITVGELMMAFFGDKNDNNNNNKESADLIERMMREVDEDGNGEIDFLEFTKIMRSIIS